MRETRLSGSEGGGAGNRSPYPYPSGSWKGNHQGHTVRKIEFRSARTSRYH